MHGKKRTGQKIYDTYRPYPVSFDSKENFYFLDTTEDVRPRSTYMSSLLLANGADVNTKTSSGRTPLHYAVERGHSEIVTLLVANGADVNSKTKQDQTPLSLAKEKGHTEIVELLLKNGAQE